MSWSASRTVALGRTSCASAISVCSGTIPRDRSATTPRVWRRARRSKHCPVVSTCSSRSEEHTSELQSLMRISYAVFCLKKKKQTNKYMKPDSTYKQEKERHKL